MNNKQSDIFKTLTGDQVAEWVMSAKEYAQEMGEIENLNDYISDAELIRLIDSTYPGGNISFVKKIGFQTAL